MSDFIQVATAKSEHTPYRKRIIAKRNIDQIEERDGICWIWTNMQDSNGQIVYACGDKNMAQLNEMLMEKSNE